VKVFGTSRLTENRATMKISYCAGFIYFLYCIQHNITDKANHINNKIM